MEFALAAGLLLLPVAFVVLGFGPWSERRVLAEAAAAEAARAAVIALDTSVGARVVSEMTADHGLSPSMVRLGWCGGAPGPVGGSPSCSFARGTEVVARVEVWVPLVATPWGDLGGLWVGAVHAEPIDLYRSLG